MAVPTIKASELITLIQKEMDRFGDRPTFITDHGKGELPLSQSSVRFAERVSARKSRSATEAETLNGRFFVLSDI